MKLHIDMFPLTLPKRDNYLVGVYIALPKQNSQRKKGVLSSEFNEQLVKETFQKLEERLLKRYLSLKVILLILFLLIFKYGVRVESLSYQQTVLHSPSSNQNIEILTLSPMP